MRSSSVVAAASLWLSAGHVAAAAAAAPSRDATSGLEIANQYIIEYAQGASPAARSKLAIRGAPVNVLKTFNSPIFSGAAIELAPDQDVSHVSSAPEIAQVWPNRRVALVQPEQDRSTFADDVGAGQYDTHGVTGVDLLHRQGILGAGVKVGVVDTGVWYRHPALGGGFGPGFKVAGGWDFVGDANTFAGEPKQPDADPINLPDSGHGTHVAGIVAAVSNRFVGVAPNATLYAYKVTGVYEGTDEATLIDAFLRAEADGMDVITASFSLASGWADNAWAVVSQRIVEAGVVVTVAAGNDGASGAFVGTGAGSAPDVLSVTSIQAESAPATPYRVTLTTPDGQSNTTLTGYLSDDVFPSDMKDWPVIDMGDPNGNGTGDACQPFPAGSANLTRAVALVGRGGCSYFVKQTNLLALGGSYMLVYNDARAPVPPGNTRPDCTLGLITAEAGVAMLKALRQDNATMTADFSSVDSVVGIVDPTANTPNYYAGWSATYDLQLKPDVAAPGGNIFSTWSEGQYAVQSGTSMSTPYLAGVAALYIGVHGGRQQNGPAVARDFHDRVVASGMSLPWTTIDGVKSSVFVAPPVQMGSGLVNAVQTLWPNTTIDTRRINLNDTAHFQGSHQITITNRGSSDATYNFTLEPAAGFEIQDPFIPTWQTWGIKQYKDLVPLDLVPDVQLPEAITISPGMSKTVTFEFANPQNKGWNATVIPLYSGKVKIAGSNEDQLSVPYMGIASSLYETKKVFQAQYPTMNSGRKFQSIDVSSVFNFNATSPDFEFVAYYYLLDWGVHEMRWDVFESDWDESKWTFPPTEGFIGAVAHWNGDFNYQSEIGNLTDPAYVQANTIDTPFRSLARDGFATRAQNRFHWVGQMAGRTDGSVLAPGNYTLRVAASKPFGDPNKVGDWEVWRREITVVA